MTAPELLLVELGEAIRIAKAEHPEVKTAADLAPLLPAQLRPAFWVHKVDEMFAAEKGSRRD